MSLPSFSENLPADLKKTRVHPEIIVKINLFSFFFRFFRLFSVSPKTI